MIIILIVIIIIIIIINNNNNKNDNNTNSNNNNNNNWRASRASETLSGVTQLKIRDICLLASERDSIRDGQCKIGYMFDVYIYMYGLYVCPLNARAGTVFLLKTRPFRLDPCFFYYSIKKVLLGLQIVG